MLFVIEDIGGRNYQEDRHSVFFGIYKDINYYAVFDGHGDEKVAVFMKLYFKDILVIELMQGEKSGRTIHDSIFNAFKRLQSILPQSIAMHAGSTALVIVQKEDTLYVANVGDSRAVINVNKKAFPITEDHKPSKKEEYERITQVGGTVITDPFGVPRVNGNLALSRAIGDLYLAPAITWVPDIYTLQLTKSNNFLVAASDGLWDVVSNQELVDFIHFHLSDIKLHKNPKAALNNVCSNLLKHARQKGSTDNVTILLLIL